MRPTVLAYDVNETLLDLSALDDAFADVLGDAALRPAWFQTMLQLSFVGIVTGRYVDFTSAQHAALRMVARRTGREISDAGAERVVGGMQRLPAHPDVPDALDALRAAGYRQVTLTNSPLLVARAQLRHAGLMIMLVAAHAWDVSGALAAGARAAFVARPGMVPSPLGDQPEMVVDDIAALAEELTT